MAATAPPPRGRIIQLDVLRFLAVALVLGRHVWPIPEQASATGRVLKAAGDVWQRGGWVGVDLFFVLSGFLVSRLLFREYAERGRIDFKRFFIRRGLKIYPPFYLMVLFTLALQLRAEIAQHFTHTKDLLLRFLREALFIQNYGPGLWPHTWSLAVEEHFYILLPLTLIYLYRRRREGGPFPQLPALVAAVACVCLALRLATSYALPFDVYTHAFPTHLRLDSLAFGVLLSYFYELYPDRLKVIRARPRPALLLGVACVAPAFVLGLGGGFFLHTLGFTLLYIGFGVLMVLALDFKPGLPRPVKGFVRFLAYLGARSYSIYLWHFLVRTWGIGLVTKAAGVSELNYALRWSIYMAGSIVVGVVLSNAIEFPILRLRDRFFPRRSRVAQLSN